MIWNKSLCYNKLLFDQDKREGIYFQIEAEIWGHKQTNLRNVQWSSEHCRCHFFEFNVYIVYNVYIDFI